MTWKLDILPIGIEKAFLKDYHLRKGVKVYAAIFRTGSKNLFTLIKIGAR